MFWIPILRAEWETPIKRQRKKRTPNLKLFLWFLEVIWTILGESWSFWRKLEDELLFCQKFGDEFIGMVKEEENRLKIAKQSNLKQANLLQWTYSSFLVQPTLNWIGLGMLDHLELKPIRFLLKDVVMGVFLWFMTQSSTTSSTTRSKQTLSSSAAISSSSSSDLIDPWALLNTESLNECLSFLLFLLFEAFRAFRNSEDLSSASIPRKYMDEVGDFYRYYSGELTAPILTIFIGGNHENSNLSQSLLFGGWAAPNIYYMGSSGVIVLSKGETKLRIGGVSGIYNYHDFHKGYDSSLPLSGKNDTKNVYHVREFDIFKLSLLPLGHLDVMLSHDWPQSIYSYGNVGQLLRVKKHLASDVNLQ